MTETETTANKRRKGPTQSVSEAAGLLGVHRNTLSGWLEKEGAPFVRRSNPALGQAWEVNLAEIVRWLIDREVAKIQEKTADLLDGEVSKDEADRRRAVALAVKAEIEVEEQLGNVVLVSDVAQRVADEYGAVRANLSGIGAKVAGRAATMTNAAEIQELVDDGIRGALEELRAAAVYVEQAGQREAADSA